jgi:glycogen debranching enzyme
VWPVEHGVFAMGAYRGGFHERLQQVAKAMFEAASIFDSSRLPECFSGHQRDDAHPFPSLYPPANAPQAWSASTPFALVQAMLGLSPCAPECVLLVDPRLPPWLPRLTLRGLRVGAGLVDLAFSRNADGQTDMEVQHLEGTLRVERRASPWSLATRIGEARREFLAA